MVSRRFIKACLVPRTSHSVGFFTTYPCHIELSFAHQQWIPLFILMSSFLCLYVEIMILWSFRQIILHYVKPSLETIFDQCMNTCFYFPPLHAWFSTIFSFCLILHHMSQWHQLFYKWIPAHDIFNKNISSLIMLLFNSPKPIRGLDALTIVYLYLLVGLPEKFKICELFKFDLLKTQF